MFQPTCDADDDDGDNHDDDNDDDDDDDFDDDAAAADFDDDSTHLFDGFAPFFLHQKRIKPRWPKDDCTTIRIEGWISKRRRAGGVPSLS